MNNSIHIFSLADKNYGVHLGVAITSILMHANDPAKLFFYIMDGGISKQDKSKLIKITKEQIEFIEMDDKAFEKLPLAQDAHFTRHTYYRFLVPILKPELDKALYLDCDLVAQHPLDELWATDVDSYLAAACEDTWKFPAFEWKLELGLAKESFYFNAGVMLLNTRKMREEKLTERFFQTTNAFGNKLKYLDQDVMNVDLEGRVLLLPLKWNVQQTAFFETGTIQYNSEDISQAKAEPWIIHFSGGIKPWQIGCLNPLWKQYFRYLLKSPWRGNVSKYYMLLIANGLSSSKRKFKQKIKSIVYRVLKK